MLNTSTTGNGNKCFPKIMNEIQKIFLSAYMILIHTLSGNCIAIVDKEMSSISHKDSGI